MHIQTKPVSTSAASLSPSSVSSPVSAPLCPSLLPSTASPSSSSSSLARCARNRLFSRCAWGGASSSATTRIARLPTVSVRGRHVAQTSYSV